MATFAQLKKTAQKLGLPPALASKLVKLAKSPDSQSLEEIAALFEDDVRKPTKAELGQLVKIAAQAQIDYPSNPKEKTVVNIQDPVNLPVLDDEEKPETKKPAAKEEKSTAKEEPETTFLDDAILEESLVMEEPAQEPIEQFLHSDYEQVSLSLSPERSPQTLKMESGNGSMLVSWAKSSNEELVYVIAASNTSMPTTPKNAEKIQITRLNQISFPEEFKFFKLFEFEKPGTKGQPIASGQVLGDITEFVIETYPHEVRIKWDSSDPSATVAIYKSRANEGLPSNLTAEFKLDVQKDSTNLTDRNVQPGQSFEYCAVLESQTVSGTVDLSSGKRQRVAIPGDVPKVDNFNVEFDSVHETVNISYARPKLALAKVKIFQIPGVPSLDLKQALADERVIPFERLKQQDIEDWLGKEIIESEVSNEEKPGVLEIQRIPLRDPDKKGSVTYVAVSTLGSEAIISTLQVMHLVGSIGELALLDRYDYQILRTEVPEGAVLLKVYLAPPNSAFEEAKLDSPRNVVVSTEYRRFGGIIWGDGIPGVSGVNRLPVTPMRIWVEGVAMYDGKAHSGAPRFVDYEGRVDVNYQLAIPNKEGSSEPVQKKKFFGKKDVETKATRNPNRLVKVKVLAPANTGDLKFTIRTTPKGIFHLDESSATSSPEKVTLLASDFKVEKELLLETTGKPFVFNSEVSDFRLKSVGLTEKDTPRFIIDSVVSSQSKPLDENQGIQQTLSVAILGAKQSGKTTYLQALLNYFDQQFSAKYATKLAAPDGNVVSESKLAELREFIQTGTLPEATKSAANAKEGSDKDPRKPIQFEFGGNASPIKGIDIYDLAGEDMDSQKTMSLYKSELSKVDLIILLVDPMQDPAMEQVLKGAVAAPPKGTAPFDVLNNLEKVLEAVETRNTNQKLAVVVSKFDGIEIAAEMKGTPVYGMLDKGLSMTRDVNTNSTMRYNERDGITLDREVMALLNKLSEMAAFTRSLADTTTFAHKRCFVVSSLGHSTDATRMDKAGITSFRISDPILWALEG